MFDTGIFEAAGNHTPFFDIARYETAVAAVHGDRSYRKMLPSRSVCHRSDMVDAKEHRPWETRLTQFFIPRRLIFIQSLFFLTWDGTIEVTE